MDFENGNVLQQLRCGGVLEAVRISCAGFPTKFPFEDFVDHFWNLVPELLARDDLDDAALARAACQKARLQGFQIGRTKVPTLPNYPAPPLATQSLEHHATSDRPTLLSSNMGPHTFGA